MNRLLMFGLAMLVAAAGAGSAIAASPPAAPPKALSPATKPAPTTTTNAAALVKGGPYGVNVITGVPYATVNGKTLTLDLYLPKQTKYATPVIVFAHGGGFARGNSNKGRSWGKRAAERGYALASINYRLSGEAPMPAPIHDEFGAIRFLRANAAKYNLDPKHVATMGLSAGSFLSTIVGVVANDSRYWGTVGGNLSQSSSVQAVVAISGEWFSTDAKLLNRHHQELHNTALGCTDVFESPGCQAKVRLYFPEFHLDARDPPVLIAQGGADTAAPPANAIHLADAMKKAGMDVTLFVNEGRHHGGKNGRMRMDDINAFLDRAFAK